MIKPFVNLDAENLCREINTFENKMSAEGFEVFATQTHKAVDRPGEFVAFVYYRKTKALPHATPNVQEERVVNDLKEIGVGYPDRKYAGKLSIKLTETDEWKSYKTASFKETPEGLCYKDLILKETDPEWRKENPKRPLYKVYQKQ